MKYFLLRIDSLLSTFSIIESGKTVSFEYKTALNQEILKDICVDDIIIGCSCATNTAKMLFRVNKIDVNNKINLSKEIEVSKGGSLSENLIDMICNNDLSEITEEQYRVIYAKMLEDIFESKRENDRILTNDEFRTDFTIEELGLILSSMYKNSDEASKTAVIHMFGIKYGKQINDKKYSTSQIIQIAGIKESYHFELINGIRIYESIRNNEFGVKFYENEQEKDISNNKLENCLNVNREPRTNKTHPLNMIIYGAPGTGKTYSTSEYALAILENRAVDTRKKSEKERRVVLDLYNDYIRKGQVVFNTFHQSYGYEEFIQGLRPDSKAEKISFIKADGVFKRIADVALNDQVNNYVIIIDEINRANISKVFGELITLVEDDKRWGEINETCATLQSGDVFAVPNNLYIIGTMNSADKSISLIDSALRRRFDFIEQKPEPDLVDDPKMRSVLIRMNTKLAEELDSSDLLIGHSYFMNRTIEVLASVFNNKIIPLLYEYFYDNKKKVAKVLDYSIGDLNFEIVDEKFGRLIVKKKED